MQWFAALGVLCWSGRSRPANLPHSRHIRGEFRLPDIRDIRAGGEGHIGAAPQLWPSTAAPIELARERGRQVVL